MVLHPDKEDTARAIFEKWDLDFAIIGETIAEDRFLVMHGNATRADIPLRALSGNAPEYDRPWAPTPAPAPFAPLPDTDPITALRALISSPNHAHKGWVWEQYDHTVLADTIRPPGHGAGVVRVHGTDKALAFTADVTPRYVVADPVAGGRQAVAEAYRNLSAVGARPLAATDNLNFGNPEKPAIMGQLVGAVQGIGDACAALDMPIVSGNVSLYNETDGRAILPTPTIGAVGLLERADEMIGALAQPGDAALVIGTTAGHLGQSALMAELWGRAEGPPPPVDLDAERRHGQFLRDNRAHIRAATDLSDGGLALAAFEMADASGIGVALDAGGVAALFGEDQARYLVACDAAGAEALLAAGAQAGVPVMRAGRFGGDDVILGESRAPCADLSQLYRGALAAALATPSGAHGLASETLRD